MNDMTDSNIRPRQRRKRPLALLGAALGALALTAQAADLETGKADELPVYRIQLAGDQVTAHDARRAAYRYLAGLGYTSGNGIGAARVRSMTRDGDTWILRIAFSRGGRALSQRAVLYVDADTEVVSEVPPAGADGPVAAK